MRTRGLLTALLAIFVFLGGCGAGTVPRTGLPVKPLSSLPAQAAETWRLIQQGGPFPYRKDGVTFENRERLLPTRSRGYYREYTVPTPGRSDRGARRLVTGRSSEVYYTSDHYRSFVSVDVTR
ncbi:ribonuclease domain-containing protein [Nonomuraea sp. NPDC050310]|uniref:ribonuclease domain-containing protein n=1 Tax=unclassified Nonomuraea TaxID=2593643 RepID=UPI0033E793F1